MSNRPRAVRWPILALGFAAWASMVLAQSPDIRGREVALLALPSSIGGKVTPETRHLVSEVASSLRAAGVRVVIAGVETQVPLEELTATANASGPDVTIALRSLGPSTTCAATITPQRIPKPPQSEAAGDDAQLRRMVKQLWASSRAEVSSNLAAAVASVVRCCPRRATETEQYVLESTYSPMVVLSLGSSDEDVLLPQVPAVLKRSMAMAHE